jgi:hypothetical protein
MDEKYYVPGKVNPALFDLTNDLYEVEKRRLREAHK